VAETIPVHDRALSRLASVVSELDVKHWSFLSQGYLGVVLKSRFPTLSPPVGISTVDRFSVRMVQLFTAVRMEHMSGGFYLLLLGGFAILYLFLLNATLGALPEKLIRLDMVLAVPWVLGSLATMHTHFSGGETMRSRFRKALLLFGSALVFMIGSVLLRWLVR
jgi:hypothetical protein